MSRFIIYHKPASHAGLFFINMATLSIMNDLGGITIKVQNDNKKVEKLDFLSELIRMDKDQINDMIKAKSKKPKLICPLIIIKKDIQNK